MNSETDTPDSRPVSGDGSDTKSVAPDGKKKPGTDRRAGRTEAHRKVAATGKPPSRRKTTAKATAPHRKAKAKRPVPAVAPEPPAASPAGTEAVEAGPGETHKENSAAGPREARPPARPPARKPLPAVARSLPVLTPEGSLSRYLQEIRKFPMLSPEEEYMLAKAWVEHGDTQAAHRLVTSHLRLVAKIAMGYRGYGLPVSELIAEGNVGMMQAVKRFDPEKGFRLATYAMWWIRAAIQEYILRSWSLVKMGTTAAQKKLFFNLRRLKNRLQALEEGDLKPEDVRRIATELGVSEEEVVSMNRRMAGGDHSLNAPLRQDGDGEWQDWLVDEGPGQEEIVAEREEFRERHALLEKALERLNERERHIFVERRLAEEPKTLEELSKVYGVSRERIRQIEVRAFEKVQQAVRELAAERGLVESTEEGGGKD